MWRSVLIVSLFVVLPAFGQLTDAERLELAQKKLEERLKSSATRPAATAPAVSTPAPKIGVFEAALREAADAIRTIDEEKAPPGLTSIQRREWEAAQLRRRDHVIQTLGSKPIEAALSVVDVKSEPDGLVVYATCPLELPETVARGLRERLVTIAKSYDDRIAKQTAEMRSLTGTRRKDMLDHIEATRDERDAAMTKERKRQASIRQKVEIAIVGAPGSVAALQRGSRFTLTLVVKSLRVSGWDDVIESRDPPISDEGAIFVEATHSAATVVNPALPATQPVARAPVPALADELAATLAKLAATDGNAAPPPGMTTIQAQQWRERQASERAAAVASLQSKVCSVTLRVDDVVPIKAVSRSLQGADTNATAAVVSEMTVAGQKIGVVLVADDDRFAAKNRGDTITTAAEVLAFRDATRAGNPEVVLQVADPRPVVAAARNVVYLVDATGTMINKIGTMKGAVADSIAALPKTSMFNIVTSSDGGRSQTFRKASVAPATDVNLSARAFLDQVTPTGTDGGYVGALDAVVRLRPDAVWFYTDGEFNDPKPVLAGIRDAVRRGNFRLHVVLAETYDKQSWNGLKAIAEESGGTFTDVRGRTLKP